MTIQELFIRSNQALEDVVMEVKNDQWKLDMPAISVRTPTDLKTAIQYHTYDDAWVPDVLAGKTAAEVGEAHELLLSSPDFISAYHDYNHRAVRAVREFTNLEAITHLSYGDFPAKDYLQHIISFRALRSYDIAKLIGIDTTMETDFVEALLAEFSPVIEDYRRMGVFPAPLHVADNASPQAKLLAMVGRS